MQPDSSCIKATSRNRQGSGKHSGVIGKAFDVALILRFKFCKLAAHNLHRAMVARLTAVVASPDGTLQSFGLRITTAEALQ
jgi:hypothetical protein